MKVLLVNGSSHEKGTTSVAVAEAVKTFEAEGVETEVFNLGAKAIADCLQCGYCFKNGSCVIKDDAVNEFVEKARQADGFIFASPVYYAHPSGRILAFLDRAFFSGKDAFAYKPGASIAVARRAGTTATFDVLNKYFGISNMPVVGSTYWNNVHGMVAEDAVQDLEGLQSIRNLARNMVATMKCFEWGRQQGIYPPACELEAHTNFVR